MRFPVLQAAVVVAASLNRLSTEQTELQVQRDLLERLRYLDRTAFLRADKPVFNESDTGQLDSSRRPHVGMSSSPRLLTLALTHCNIGHSIDARKTMESSRRLRHPPSYRYADLGRISRACTRELPDRTMPCH